MRVFYDNILPECQFRYVTNQDSNYPYTNLYHNYLVKRFQTNDDSCVIEYILDQERIINCMVLGYHNLSQDSDITIRVFFGPNVEFQETFYITDPEKQIFSFYFDDYLIEKQGPNWPYIRITINNSEANPFFIGSLYVGKYVDLPEHTARPEFSIDVFSEVAKSITGQTSKTEEKEGLEGFSLNFPLIKDIEIFKNYFRSVSNNPHFLNLYHNENGKNDLLYCNITNTDTLFFQKKIYTSEYEFQDITINYQESR